MSITSSRLVAIPVLKTVKTPHSYCDEDYDNYVNSSLSSVLPFMYVHVDGVQSHTKIVLLFTPKNMRFHGKIV